MRTLPPLFNVCLLLFLGAAAPASAYVRSYIPVTCKPVFWAQSCVYITVDRAGVPEMPLVEVERIVQASILSWQSRTRDSSFLRLNYLPADVPREVDNSDSLQTIKFYPEKWCRPALSSDDKEVCYDPAAVALTTVSYVTEKAPDPRDIGKLVDADIEFNAVYNYFYDADKNPNPETGLIRRPADLWNTLTHELGHLQGLEHSCRRGAGDSMPACTRDSNGEPVISCGTVESGRSSEPELERIYETTMYPTAEPRQTNKRIPHADDLAGIINIYPLVNDPYLCKLPAAAVPKGGCGAAAGERPRTAAELLSAAGLLAGALALLLLRRRSSGAAPR